MVAAKDYSICITGAVAGPKLGVGKWDPGGGSVETPDLAKIANAMAVATPGAIAVGAVEVLHAFGGHVSAPDIRGTATITNNDANTGAYIQLPLSAPDQYVANWGIKACLTGDLDKNTGVSVNLWDEDRDHADSLGTVIVTNRDLKAALKARNAYAVRVDGQSSSQILYVSVYVHAGS